ncbi:MAG: AAA family ATPase [Planctomycetes bacterium]|nr:AAA family ATPase [Planctomycetota bacterium]
MRAPESLIPEVTAGLAQRLPGPLADVLLAAVRWRPGQNRLVAVLPNQVWYELFREHAEESARELLAAHQCGLHVASRQGVEVESRDGQRRFATFLKDPGNQLALAACRRVVEAPGIEHNPLYLHGQPGSGKTHLLGAVAADFRAMLGEQAVVEFNGPGFVAREAQQLAERGATPLRLAISHAAAIVFDQVDALAGRALAQEELFHLINSCMERGQQLVFAGSAPPRKLAGIEDRLITRLGWGLAVPIEPPLTETRLALLRQIAGPIAEAMDPAELTKLVDTLAPDMHQVAKLAERLLEGERVVTGTDVASFDRILQVVAERYDLRPGDIAGKRRLRQVAQARQVALLLGRRLTAHSLDALGGMVGGRDHSTVLYSIRQAEERVAKDPELAREVGELTQAILGGEDHGRE